MFGPMKEGTIEVLSSTGVVVGHGFVEQVGGAQRQRWILLPEYISPPEAEVVMRGSALQHPDAGAWLEAMRRDPWREGSRYVEATCVEGDEQIEIREQLVGILQQVHSKEELVGVVFSRQAAGERNDTRRTFSGVELPPLYCLDEHWWLSPSFQAPPIAAIELRSTSRSPQDLDAPTHVKVSCVAFGTCPDLHSTPDTAHKP